MLTFRGSEKDVLCRTLDCIKKFNIKYFLRVCADRIFFDHEEISKVLFKYKKNIQNYDFISNNKPKVDPGLTIEIVSSSALKRVSKDKFKRKLSVEHITKAFYNYNKDFNIHFIRSPNYFYQGLKYTIDQKKDLDRSNFIFDKLKKYKFFRCNEIYKKVVWKINYLRIGP